MKGTLLLFTLSLISLSSILGQKADERQREIGIQYFGELGLHPGIEVDYFFPIGEKTKEKEKRQVAHQLAFRPSIAYYYLPQYSHNFLLTPSINYRLKVTSNESGRYCFAEPYFKFGYLRYAYIGKIYETTDTGFEERKFGGGNAFVFGSGLNFGGSLKLDKWDWLVGCEYLGELSEGALFVNHINFKVGTRLKL